MRKPLTILAAGAIAIASVGFAATAMAKHSSPGGEFNLQISGYELISNNSTQSRIDLKGRGTILADPTGGLSSGAVEIEAVNSVLPEASPVASTCSGSATGQITAGANDTWTMTLDYADSANSGQCLSQTFELFCSRAVSPAGLAYDEAAGSYDCVVTGVSGVTATGESVDAASLGVHFGAHAVVE